MTPWHTHPGSASAFRLKKNGNLPHAERMSICTRGAASGNQEGLTQVTRCEALLMLGPSTALLLSASMTWQAMRGNGPPATSEHTRAEFCQNDLQAFLK